LHSDKTINTLRLNLLTQFPNGCSISNSYTRIIMDGRI